MNEKSRTTFSMEKSNLSLVSCSYAFSNIAMCNFPRLAQAACPVLRYDWLTWCLKLLRLVNAKFLPFTFYGTRYKSILTQDTLKH